MAILNSYVSLPEDRHLMWMVLSETKIPLTDVSNSIPIVFPNHISVINVINGIQWLSKPFSVLATATWLLTRNYLMFNCFVRPRAGLSPCFLLNRDEFPWFPTIGRPSVGTWNKFGGRSFQLAALEALVIPKLSRKDRPCHGLYPNR